MQRRSTRKTIDLPSGGRVTVRKLSGLDMVGGGFVPKAFPQEKLDAINSGDLQEITKEDAQQLGAIWTAILTKCTSPVSTIEGDRLRIVDKGLDKAAADEITLGEMDDEDVMAIVSTCMELSGLTKEAGRKAQGFPGEQATAPES